MFLNRVINNFEKQFFLSKYFNPNEKIVFQRKKVKHLILKPKSNKKPILGAPLSGKDLGQRSGK